jgi:DNA modification methylase
MTEWRNRIIETRTVTAAELRANPLNWRRHPDAQAKAIRGLLSEVGIVAPLVAYESQRHGGLTLIDGHMRKDSGGTWPVTILDVTDEEADLILATFDPISALAETDAGILDALLREVNTGEEALQELLAGMAEDAGLYADGKQDVDAEPQIDRAAELQAKWQTATGQLWQLGEHRLICGDCTDAAVVARLMGGEKAALVFTDPPYNVDVAGGSHNPRDTKNYRSGNTIGNDKLSDADFYNFLRTTLRATASCMADGAAIYVCFSDSEIKNFVNAFCDAGFYYSQMVIWKKQQMVFGRKDYHSQHEPILYGWKAGAGHYFVDDRTQVTVWEIDRPMRSEKEHPTQKPTDLYARAMANSSKVGAVIYEPFSGSGTAIIACEQLGRKCRAVEVSPGYCAVALQRFEDATSKTPVLLTD